MDWLDIDNTTSTSLDIYERTAAAMLSPADVASSAESFDAFAANRSDAHAGDLAAVTSALPPYNYSAYEFACMDVYNATEYRFEFYMYGIALNVVGIIGILGNIVTMIILSRPQMRSSINYLLIGLARCDTFLILAAILLFGLRSVYPYTGYMFTYNFYIYPRIAPIVYPISAASQTASSYLTLMVSLERYVAVCHPLRARALCTYGRSRYYVAFCAVLAIMYNFVKLWEAVTLQYDSPLLGRIYCVASSPLRKDPVYINVYIHWCYLIVNYFVPFTGLVVFNTLIFRQVRRANRERQRLSRSERREIGLATMLLAVVVVFFTLNVLALYVNVRETFFQHIDDDMIVVSNLCVTFNSCVNFIIYVIFGEKFKRLFFALFCKCLQSTPDGLIHDDSSYSNGGGDGTPGCHMRHGSQRINRHGTMRCSRHGFNTTVTSLGASLKAQRSVRVRAPSPGPCVYYPGREMQRTMSGFDWDGAGGPAGLTALKPNGNGTFGLVVGANGTNGATLPSTGL